MQKSCASEKYVKGMTDLTLCLFDLINKFLGQMDGTGVLFVYISSIHFGSSAMSAQSRFSEV